MNNVTPRLPSQDSALHNGYQVLSSRLGSALETMRRRVAVYHEEAMLRSLDRRLLEDIGFELPSRTEYRPDHVCRNEFTPLWEVFSWTRFGK